MKLGKFGVLLTIAGMACNLLSSYIENKKQETVIEDLVKKQVNIYINSKEL